MTIKKLNVVLASAAFVVSQYAVAAPRQKAPVIHRQKYVIPDAELHGGLSKKRQVQKNLTHEQFADILEELAAARITIKDLNDKIQIYDQLKDKLEEENNKKLAALKEDYEQKIKEYEQRIIDIEKNKSSQGDESGAYASKEMIEKMKAEGVDIKKVKFRVQIGEVNSYKAADKLKNKIRELDVQTWIIPIYKGYIIPLNLILEQIRSEKD